MTTGYVSEEYARMEHALWLASIPQEPPYVIEVEEEVLEPRRASGVRAEEEAVG
jgi:hypothetical protein